MIKRLLKLIAVLVAAYILLRFVSAELANSTLVVFLIVLIPVLIVRNIFVQFIYKHSISIVGKQFIMAPNTIYNEYCTIKYVPDSRIIVTDNTTVTRRKKVRQFVVEKSYRVNVNRLWNKICKVFDSFITLDMMAKFCSYDAKIDIKMLKTAKNIPDEPKVEIVIEEKDRAPRFVDIESIKPDTYAADSAKKQAEGDNFVDINQMQKKEKDIEREITEPEFIDMTDVLNSGSKKIDVNRAGESELLLLSGMTKENAKKIVEYRNVNGYFKDKKAFLDISGLGEEDIIKIIDLINVTIPEDEYDKE